MSRFLREDLINYKSYQADSEKLNIMLNANESFIDIPNEIRELIIKEMMDISFNRYPDADSRLVCKLYSSYAGVDHENIIAGNGSDELISIIFDSFIEVNDKVMIIKPDFSMYNFYATKSRAKVLTYDLDDEFSMNIDGLIEEIINVNPKIFIFSNPNNPTGKAIPVNEVEKIIKKCSCLVIVDEAYFEFNGENAAELIEKYDNLIVLRTCSKAFGIPSLRLGFAIGSRELICDMKKVKPPYNVSIFTQKVGEVMLKNTDFIQKNVISILNEKYFLNEGLKKIRCIKSYDSRANYFLIETDKAETLYSELIKNQILVRKFSSQRLSDCLRITVGNREENEKILCVLNNFS